MSIISPEIHLSAQTTNGCNRLLESMSPSDFALLEPHLKLITLHRDQILFEAGDDVTHIHFPCEGAVTAIMILNEEGKYLEAATIGREGAIGGIVSHGHKPAYGCGLVQIPGKALRLPSERLEEAKRRSPALADLFCRYADYLLAQVMQFSACNAFHNVEQRLCRTLIMAQDRTGEDMLDFTQQSLADSLGVQRTTVTMIAKDLETKGVIRTRRGHIQLLQRSALEKRACGCYVSIEEHFARLLPNVQGALSA
jgi:CRP-like cAMP-binding protein